MKEKIFAVFGAISAVIGSIGAVIAGTGLCACILAPTLSFIGIISITASFLSNNKTIFLISGITLLVISGILYKRKKTCKRHK